MRLLIDYLYLHGHKLVLIKILGTFGWLYSGEGNHIQCCSLDLGLVCGHLKLSQCRGSGRVLVVASASLLYLIQG